MINLSKTLFLRGSQEAQKRFWNAAHYSQDQSPSHLCIITTSWPVVQSDPKSDIGIRTDYESIVRTVAMAAGLEVLEESSAASREHALVQVREGFNLLNQIRAHALDLCQACAVIRPDKFEGIYIQLNAACNSLGCVLDRAKWFVEGKQE